MRTKDAVGAAQAPAAEPRYAIMPELFEAQGRSMTAIVVPRLCDECASRSKAPLASLSFKQLRALARKHCTVDSIPPRAPVLEAIFRLLLISPDGAAPLSALHEQLNDLWMRVLRPQTLSREALARVLRYDTRYGIVELTD